MTDPRKVQALKNQLSSYLVLNQFDKWDPKENLTKEQLTEFKKILEDNLASEELKEALLGRNPNCLLSWINEQLKSKEHDDIERERESKIKVKLLGCRCGEHTKGLEFDIDLKGEPYDENKDLVTCPQCWKRDEYRKYPKKQIGWQESVDKGRRMVLTIIYGVKTSFTPPPPPPTKKRERGLWTLGARKEYLLWIYQQIRPMRIR